MKFDPIVPNPDIDVHPDPPGLWQHVAVICRWKDARAQRKQWSHAAVVGPLRTVRGLDELARNLLHNPQIRVVLVVGSDLTEGEETTKALTALWKGEPEGEKHIGEDVRGPFWDAQVLVQLVLPDDPNAATWRALAQFADSPPPWTYETKPATYNPACGHRHGMFGCTNDWCGYGAEGFRPLSTMSPLAALVPSDTESERPKVTLPPPPPAANATAPAGDPGERVVGETLADLWPAVLHRAMRFGRTAPTQYGPTRELLCLVAVVRDVAASIAELDRTRWICPTHGWAEVTSRGAMHESCPTCGGYLPEPDDSKHPVLGITCAQAEAYHRKVTQATVPEGAPYSYGSRMRGVAGPAPEPKLQPDGNFHITFGPPLNFWPDQIAKLERLLAEKLDTRAAYVTPWRPAEDSGKESGRPCMVGAWWRVTEEDDDEP